MYNYYALFAGIVFCCVVRLMYAIVDAYLAGRNAMYDALPPFRKMYVQKNIVKSSCLAFMLPLAVGMVVYPIWRANVWHTFRIHFFAVAYGANDLVGLVCVERLPKTTRIHHTISSLLVLASLALEFQVSPVAQSMLVYTFFAASAYIVNLHLAIRLLFPSGTHRRLRRAAAVIYAATCSMSWCWQIWWAWTTPLVWYNCVYISMMLWIVRDDIILMQWLVSI